MKNRTAIIVFAIAFGLLSCKDAATTKSTDEKVTSSEKTSKKTDGTLAFNTDETTAIFQQYNHIKTAMVASDAAAVKTGANALLNVSEDATLKEIAQTIADADGIENQRKALPELTASVERLLDNAITSGAIYKQYCPMAFNNTGAYWLSSEKEIRNPYFGDAMLSCGSVKETLN